MIATTSKPQPAPPAAALAVRKRTNAAMMGPEHAYAAQHALRPRQEEGDAVAANAALVRRIARQLAAKLPASVEFDDLVQAGTIGLLEALRRYDPGHGASFETYSATRIHGAMLDELRRADWTPRSVHRRLRDADKARLEVERRCGRAAGAAEVASAMALSTADYRKLLDDAGRSRLLSLEAQIESHGDGWLAADAATPELLLSRAGFHAELAAAIRDLPSREQFAVTSYFQHGMSLRDIGTALGIGESRACQIIGQATRQLKSRLAGWERLDAGD